MNANNTREPMPLNASGLQLPSWNPLSHQSRNFFLYTEVVYIYTYPGLQDLPYTTLHRVS